MTTTLQHLHMSDFLTHDEDIDENGPNYIEYLRMLPGQTNENFTIEDSAELQTRGYTTIKGIQLGHKFIWFKNLLTDGVSQLNFVTSRFF